MSRIEINNFGKTEEGIAKMIEIGTVWMNVNTKKLYTITDNSGLGTLNVVVARNPDGIEELWEESLFLKNFQPQDREEVR